MQDRTDTSKYTILDFIRMILIHEIDIDEDRVNIFNERFDIPEYDGLFIVIESKSTKVISNRNIPVPSDSGITETQELTVLNSSAISLMSRNREAEQKKEEVIMALQSIYSQQCQEKYSFRLYRNPVIENLSGVEGAAMLNRFEISVMSITWHEKTKSADYYDTFNAEVNTENETVTIENIQGD